MRIKVVGTGRAGSAGRLLADTGASGAGQLLA
jgi:hypothetical protein